MIAAWKVGATPTPVSSRLPKRELDGIIELAKPAVIVGVDPADHPGSHVPPARAGRRSPPRRSRRARLDTVSDPWKGMTSGGSTGRPEADPQHRARAHRSRREPAADDDADGTIVMPGPLYHNGPFMWSVTALLAGNHVVLGGKFDAETHARAHRRAPPGVAVRRADDDGAHLEAARRTCATRYDVSSLNVVWHLGAPCPPWLKETWIDWLGPGRDLGAVRRHRGAGGDAHQRRRVAGRTAARSAGRSSGEMKVVRADGTDADPGEVGEIFMRPGDPNAQHVPLRRRRGEAHRRRLGVARRHGLRSTTTATCTSPTARPT